MSANARERWGNLVQIEGLQSRARQ